jgi:quercetin dioxygenase-like cupin family protein
MSVFIPADEMIVRNPVPGAVGKIVHNEESTLALWTFEEGTELPAHEHPHQQIALVVEGTLELTVGGETSTLSAGDSACIPGNVVHGARAVTRCRVVDSFYPRREDLQ